MGVTTRATTSGLDVVQDVFRAFQAGDDDGATGVGENGARAAGHVEEAVEYQQRPPIPSGGRPTAVRITAIATREAASGKYATV